MEVVESATFYVKVDHFSPEKAKFKDTTPINFVSKDYILIFRRYQIL